ncbi:MAG: GNAT family N-acetyltransferase [Pleurocapsa sp. MO_226.B13]|nr:GNAT family N-acetyltransferase [Pleurocapsa sp. MO_226.B13]
MKFLREEKGIAYKIFDISELEDMALVIGESFSNSEPMAVTQGISLSEMTDLAKQIAHQAVSESLSIVAKSQETQAIIGVLLANDWGAISSEEITLPTDKFNPILALLDGLDAQYKQGKSIGVNEYLHHEFLAVSQQHRGKNIAHNLVEIALENAINKGYRKAVVTANNPTSQHIHRKFGFQDFVDVSYKIFTYKGQKVFSSLEGKCILMNRSLI